MKTLAMETLNRLNIEFCKYQVGAHNLSNCDCVYYDRLRVPCHHLVCHHHALLHPFLLGLRPDLRPCLRPKNCVSSSSQTRSQTCQAFNNVLRVCHRQICVTVIASIVHHSHVGFWFKKELRMTNHFWSWQHTMHYFASFNVLLRKFHFLQDKTRHSPERFKVKLVFCKGKNCHLQSLKIQRICHDVQGESSACTVI